MNYFKRKWNIRSNWHLLLILLVFAATGFSYLAVKPYVLAFAGYDQIEARWLRVVVYILLAFPVYQAILLSIGGLTGQWSFFWPFVKKMNQRMFLWKRKSN